MSISLIAKLKVQPGKEAEFEAAAKEMIATVRTAEPGTLAYILHKNSKDPTEFIYYELYQDQAAFDVGPHHLEIERRDALDAHLARHLLVLEGAARILATAG